MNRNLSGGAFAVIVGIMLFLMGIYSLYEHRNIGYLMILGALVIWALIIYARTNKSPFTIAQLKLIKDLNEKEIERIRTKKQQRKRSVGSGFGNSVLTCSSHSLEASKYLFCKNDLTETRIIVII